MKTILVAEDEKAIRELLRLHLDRAGYNVLEACDGQQAQQLYQEHEGEIDLAMLDIMMPKMSGDEVCRLIREKDSELGIIFLTAKTQERDKVSGLKIGADDYISKPFSINEMLARVESVLRRVDMSRRTAKAGVSEEIILGDYVLNVRKQALYQPDENRKIDLSHTEFQIIEYLFNNPNRAIDRSELLSNVWGKTYWGDEKIVDVNIRRLRLKVEEKASDPKHLITVWGEGYMWKE